MNWDNDSRFTVVQRCRVLAVFLLNLLALSCGGRSSTTEDSETHFLHCNRTSDCAELGEQYVCHENQCRDRADLPDQDAGSVTSEEGGVSPTGNGAVFASKVDLLLMIDNSVSMADKQQMLEAAVPDLVGRLVNPICVDSDGTLHAAETPDVLEQDCPTGLHREFNPVTDINVAVISSSLGGFGSTSGACDNGPDSDQKEDMGHLIGSLPRGVQALQGSTVLNADGLGFLEWRGTGRADLEQALSSLVFSAGEFGCGFEASLEAWYRFLIDPEPYATLQPVSCSPGGTDSNCRAGSGVDQTVLDQRAGFLRPDSAVAIVMLTDENDCSVRASGQNWYMAEVGPNSPMWKAAAICETAPNDPCCYSCGQIPPMDCTADAVCGDPSNTRENGDYYVDADAQKSPLDQDNLRCFHQKQRFGMDFLYPIERYRNALTQQELCVTRADLNADECEGGRILPNPLYSAPDGSNALPTRGPEKVFLMGIIGVPWQDIARDPDPNTALEYKSYDELAADQIWPIILGDGIQPGDPLMVESVTPRDGTSPIIGQSLVAPTGGTLEHAGNGHEWEPMPPSDLQYACISPLPEVRDCSALEAANDPRHCDCNGAAPTAAGQQSKPLCQDPNGDYGTTQYYSKAYPGIRELQVLQAYGEQTSNSVVASICARNTDNPARQDYGYRPAMNALIERMGQRLAPGR